MGPQKGRSCLRTGPKSTFRNVGKRGASPAVERLSTHEHTRTPTHPRKHTHARTHTCARRCGSLPADSAARAARLPRHTLHNPYLAGKYYYTAVITLVAPPVGLALAAARRTRWKIIVLVSRFYACRPAPPRAAAIVIWQHTRSRGLLGWGKDPRMQCE